MNRTPGTKTNNPKSLMMFISSMLIFGTIGIFRKNLLLPSAFIACVRGIFGGQGNVLPVLYGIIPGTAADC